MWWLRNMRNMSAGYSSRWRSLLCKRGGAFELDTMADIVFCAGAFMDSKCSLRAAPT
jgi:hypothetical protein